MKIRKNVCVVVDAFSTGSHLAPAFLSYGYRSVHIKSSPDLPPYLLKSFRKDDFLEEFIYNQNPDELLQFLSKYSVKCVVPGTETGVLLADFLSEKLNIFSNSTIHSEAKRNKYVMHETLKSKGIRAVNHFKASNVQSIVAWAKTLDDYPIVLKPLDSAGTDGFNVCYNEQQIAEAFNRIYHSKNMFGQVNQEVLAQNYLHGQEYNVNTISCQGRHYVSEIWEVNKVFNEHSKIYDLASLVSENNDIFKLLKDYTEKVLNAFNIQYGPAHCEIILTSAGPTLVEIGARLMGAIDLSVVTEALGMNAVTLTAEAYLNSDKFLLRLEQPRPKIKKYPYMIQLISSQEGELHSFNLNELSELKTFWSMDTFLDKGDRLKTTIDLLTSPGIVFLVGQDKETLQEDYKILRELEKAGKFYHTFDKNIVASTEKHGIFAVQPSNTEKTSLSSHVCSVCTV